MVLACRSKLEIACSVPEYYESFWRLWLFFLTLRASSSEGLP